MKFCKTTREVLENKWKEKGCDFPLIPSQWVVPNVNTPKTRFIEEEKRRKRIEAT